MFFFNTHLELYHDIVYNIVNFSDKYNSIEVRVSEWLLFNTQNEQIYHLYHGENKLLFDVLMSPWC